MHGHGLDALARRVRDDLAQLAYPDKPWVEPPARADGADALDCAVVGGGQFGLAIAFGLKRECVSHVRVFDRNPRGREGPWMTFARMEMLRTPKHLTGPDLGVASLTFRAWYEAQHGADAWERLFRISRPDWQAYLGWYREVLALDVQNDVEVIDIEPLPPDLFRLTLREPDGIQTVLARTVVLASGAEGSGARVVPAFIRDALPRSAYAHTNDDIDFARLAGKRVGILGAGASAFDNAIAALKAGAASATLCFRRAQLPLANPRRWMEFSGFLAHYPELADAERWAYMQRLYDISQPPPEPTFRRAVSLPGFAMRPSTPWHTVRTTPAGSISVTTDGAPLEFDFVIAATGIAVDLALRPELARIAPHIARWADRYTPPANRADARLAGFPYMDRFSAFTERGAGAAPWASRVFAMFRGATLSMGPSAASNSNLKYTAPRIVAGVTRQLFLDAAPRYFERFMADAHHELAPDAVGAALAKRAASA
jgi:cation diffusion facilitator CzcD-associated flavoprotein CzcO